MRAGSTVRLLGSVRRLSSLGAGRSVRRLSSLGAGRSVRRLSSLGLLGSVRRLSSLGAGRSVRRLSSVGLLGSLRSLRSMRVLRSVRRLSSLGSGRSVRRLSSMGLLGSLRSLRSMRVLRSVRRLSSLGAGRSLGLMRSLRSMRVLRSLRSMRVLRSVMSLRSSVLSLTRSVLREGTVSVVATAKEANSAGVLGLLGLVATTLGGTVLLLLGGTTKVATEATGATTEGSTDEGKVHRSKERVTMDVGPVSGLSSGLVLLGGRSVVIGHGVLISSSLISVSAGKESVDQMKSSSVLSGLSSGVSGKFASIGGLLDRITDDFNRWDFVTETERSSGCGQDGHECEGSHTISSFLLIMVYCSRYLKL